MYVLSEKNFNFMNVHYLLYMIINKKINYLSNNNDNPLHWTCCLIDFSVELVKKKWVIRIKFSFKFKFKNKICQ